MSWWLWILIAIGIIALGAVKLALFNMIRKRKSEKRRFEDED
jgi:phosphatidylserine synthase